MLPHGQCEAAMCAVWGGGARLGRLGSNSSVVRPRPLGGGWLTGHLDTSRATAGHNIPGVGNTVLPLSDFSSGWKIIILKVNVLFNI